MTKTVRSKNRLLATAAACLAIVCSAVPAQGQGIELSGGVNFATISSTAVQDAARNVGMNFGIDFILPTGPVGLGVGLDFAKKGVEAVDDASSVLVDLSYIEIPVNLRLPIVGAGPIRLNLILGPRIGINTGCEIMIDQGALEDCATAADGFAVNDLDWSGTGGLGVSFALGGLAYAGADLTYVHGFSDVSADVAEALKNRAFTLQAHVGFDVF